MANGPALHDLTLTRPGGPSPVKLSTNGVAASWVVRPPGTLSAEVVTADLVAALGTTNLKNRYWVEWEHPTAGVWAGKVVNSEDTLETGTTEIAGRDYTELLAARVTAKVYDLPAINAGGMARKMLLDAGRSSPTWITGFELDPLIPAIPFAARAEQVLTAIDRLVAESDAEWQVTPERVLRVVKRLGRDVSARRQLVEQRQIVGGRFSHIGDPVRNELLAIPANADFARTTAVVVADGDSIRAEGLRQDTVVFEGMTTETQLEPAAKAALKRTVTLGEALTLILHEKPEYDGTEPCFGWMREGDRIGVLLPSVNWQGSARVLVRSLDTTTNLMTVTMGEVQDA